MLFLLQQVQCHPQNNGEGGQGGGGGQDCDADCLKEVIPGTNFLPISFF